MISYNELDQNHKEIPSDYYEHGIKKNFFQRFWHQRRFGLITQEIKKLNIKGRVLDLGCHSGDLTNIINIAGHNEVYGLDISNVAINYAKRRFPAVHFICCDLSREIPFRDNYFEAVTAFDVLEHLPNIQKILVEVKRVLKSGSYFVIGVPSENFLFKIVWFCWLKGKGRVWEGTHIHKFKAKDFKIFEQLGFARVSEKKIIFNMWYFLVFRLDKK